MTWFFTVLLEGAHVITLNDPGSNCELFVNVAGRNGDGAAIHGTHPGHPGTPGGGVPADEEFWWLLGKGQPHPRVLSHFIWREPMQPGQSSTVGLFFTDAGRNRNWDDLVAGGNAIAKAIDQPLVKLASAIVNFFVPANPDAPLGSIKISARNDGGSLSLSHEVGEFTELVGPMAPATLSDPRYRDRPYGGLRFRVFKKSDVHVFLRFILREE